MKKIVILIFVLSSSLLSFSQEKEYKKLWDFVERLEIQMLPKSASKIVDSIYIRAKKDRNEAQIIKSLLFKSKFIVSTEEEAQISVIKNLKEAINANSGVTKSILQNILAKTYYDYYERNRYRFYSRTQSKEVSDPDDFRTWDTASIVVEIHKQFQKSIEQKELLQATNIQKYSSILEVFEESKEYRPTIYDILAQRALKFYSYYDSYITEPINNFEMTQKELFSDTQTFKDLVLVSKDTSSLLYHGLLLYQELMDFHLKTKNYKALGILDLQRIKFVYQHHTSDDKEVLFINALNQSVKNYSNPEISGLFKYEIAKKNYEKIAQYRFTKNPNDKFKIRNALKICKEIIRVTPNSLAVEKAERLKKIIESKSIQIKGERHIPINKFSRLLIKYRNLDHLNFTVRKVTYQEYQRFLKYGDKKKVAFLNKRTAIKSWNINLKNELDYLEHSTEVVVPKLDGGIYIIIASEDKTITDDSTYGYSKLQITDISYVENRDAKGESYQFLNRNTGKPLQNAYVRVYSKYGSKNSMDRTFKTNKLGFINFQLDNKNYYNINFTVRKDKDIAHFEGFYFYGYNYRKKEDTSEDEEYFEIKPFTFTDRSIYRPGQKLHFKTIVVKKSDDKVDLFTNEYIDVSLNDSNHQEVKVLTLKLNEYGSVSGEFDIPNNGLTGEYYLEIEENYDYDSDFYDTKDYEFYDDNHDFSVEEYKRPTFEVSYESLKETYQVNDSVLITGNASSFSGTNISNAEVSYTVKRTVSFPFWKYGGFYGGNIDDQILINGKTTTDSDGNFKINFKAIPDEQTKKSDLPTFTYEISADITDINGETRSQTTKVKVGYHLLNASISIDEKIQKNSKENKINLNITNLNDEKADAKGTLTIYKLQAPKVPLRNRPWEAPDYQIIPEDEFNRLFPHEPYTNSDDKVKNWKKGKAVWSSKFDSNQSVQYSFKTSSLRKNGAYIAVMDSKDRLGNPVKAEKVFSIYDPKSTKVADSKLFYYQTDKPLYKIGETAKITIGTAAKDITVTAMIEKNEKIIKIRTFRLQNGMKTFAVKIKPEDENDIAIKFHFVAFNSLVTDVKVIPVLKPEKRINILTNSFRDKTQPGQEETWSFTLKDDFDNKIKAELLASMYDSSLDQFKAHSWYFEPYESTNYRPYGSILGRNSFTSNFYRFRNNYNRYYLDNSSIKHTRLNDFGFNINNDFTKTRAYLKELKEKRNNTRKEYDKTISGIVKDKDGGLPGVSVLITGTSYGTDTDFDGKFTIKVKNGDVLRFSYLGYNSVEKSVKDKKSISVVLEESDEEVLDEIVVTAYGRKLESKKSMASFSVVESRETEYLFAARLKDKDGYSADDAMDIDKVLSGAAAGVSISPSSGQSELNGFVAIRGLSSLNNSTEPLIIIDGVPINADEYRRLDKSDIATINILKDSAATALYGSRANNGVIIINTKSGQERIDKELASVQTRKNFQETAFFFPQLRTNTEGEVSFSFTMPESLTRWNLQLLAHTKDLKIGEKNLQTITQKNLMVVPNTPRFLREGDEIVISTKISNLTNKPLNGFIKLDLLNAFSGNPINESFHNNQATQNFQNLVKGNSVVSWRLKVPENIDAVTYKVIAKAGDFSDGQQDILPILSNRTLVTETMPIWVRSNQTKSFELKKLTQNSSTSLKHHKLTLEMTSNPAWYALQSLPYLMEYPYECAEQTFSRYYANSIASHVSNSSPKIKSIFEKWKNSEALLSNLEKNEELKSLVIQETPWLRDAQSETEQKKRIGLLFDLTRMKNEKDRTWKKLSEMQMSNGGFPWFKGSRYASKYITQHIVSGFGHLKRLVIQDWTQEQKKVLRRANTYLDNEFLEDYEDLLEIDKKRKSKKINDYLSKKHISYSHIQYLYGRTFYDSIANLKIKEAKDFFMDQSKKYWTEFNLYAKAQIALIHWRNGDQKFSKRIMKSLEENSVKSEELGMYWKENSSGFYFYESPIETHSLMIEAFSEITKDEKIIEELKVWLLKNKQTNRWKTTKATTEAVYALLMNGTQWLDNDELVRMKIGDEIIDPIKDSLASEAGTGYIKKSWKGEGIKNEMGSITVSTKQEGTSWGGLYWQYFEDLDKITRAETPLKLKKQLFKKVNSDRGKELIAITSDSKVKVGDLLTVRIELRVDRNMEFLHMKDMRASGVEPISVLSEYKWQDGLGYYESTRDASTNFFFEQIIKGVYVFEYDVRVNNSGDFSNGITTIQSMYAPEFSSHSEGLRIKID